MTSAVNLAKYIVTKCVNEDMPITNLQLQKILYYIQRDYLHKYNTVAFCDDVVAWKFGPVVLDVYYMFCFYGAMPIQNKYDDIFTDDDIDWKLVNEIVERKRILEPWVMVRDTHKLGGAWDKTFNKGEGNGSTIPIDLIREDI